MKKTILIEPDKTKHEYVVGIDFGHGETSAAICELEWNKPAGQRETKVDDLDINPSARDKVIPSAICRLKGLPLPLIGSEAFEHTTDNDGIRICFKQRPQSLEGDAETLMCDFMKAVYNKLLGDDRLTPTNHIVYIARPSGWVDEESKDLYRQMAINAGIPLAGLTSESRAAIFYAKSPKVKFANEIDKGAIVFDLGSSTLDFTYLSDKDSPVDFGYDLGASIIDKAVYSRLILNDENAKSFVEKYTEYRDALLFKARQFKEKAYGRNETLPTKDGFRIDQIIQENSSAYDEFEGIYIPLKVNNLQELNDMVEEETSYQHQLEEALIDFKENHIKGKKLNGVFLTGGASRMNFIRPLIAKTMNLPLDKVKIDADDPSFTISRGIALLGATDAITSHLVGELKANISSLYNDDKMMDQLIDKLANDLAAASWKEVENTCKKWVRNGSGTDEDELKRWLDRDIKKFQTTRLCKVVEESLEQFFVAQGETIRKKMNEIISRYAPGREISLSGDVKVGDMTSINKSIDAMADTVAEIVNSITNILANVLWAALGLFLFGIFAVGYYLIKGAINFFRDDSSIREDKAQALLKKKDEVIAQVTTKLWVELSANNQFKNSVRNSLSNYFTTLIESNLNKVMIPIE